MILLILQAQALPTIGHLHPEFTKVRRLILMERKNVKYSDTLKTME